MRHNKLDIGRLIIDSGFTSEELDIAVGLMIDSIDAEVSDLRITKKQQIKNRRKSIDDNDIKL